MTDFMILFVTCFLEFIMLYNISYNMINKKTTWSLNIFLIGVSYGVIYALVAYSFPDAVARLFFTIAGILIFKFLFKNKLHDAVLRWGIFHLILVIVQSPVLYVVGKIINDAYLLTVAQLISLIIILLLLKKIDLNNLLYKAERYIMLKLFIYVTTVIFLSILIYAGYDYTPVYMLYVSIMALLSLFVFLKILRQITFYTDDAYAKIHDIKNLLIGLHTTVHGTADMQVVKQSLNECMDLLNIDGKLAEIQLEKDEANILAFINQKKEQNVELVTNVLYIDKFEDLTLTTILYMLGTLLDNAIEHGGNKPILIKMLIAKSTVSISVANAYDKKKNDNFDNFFEQGQSSKAERGHGYGLSNLKKAVERYEGEITLDYSYLDEYESNYLTFKISIGTFRL